jgi:hypothetical protein
MELSVPLGTSCVQGSQHTSGSLRLDNQVSATTTLQTRTTTKAGSCSADGFGGADGIAKKNSSLRRAFLLIRKGSSHRTFLFFVFATFGHEFLVLIARSRRTKVQRGSAVASDESDYAPRKEVSFFSSIH